MNSDASAFSQQRKRLATLSNPQVNLLPDLVERWLIIAAQNGSDKKYTMMETVIYLNKYLFL
jgi:hypothetical protein